MKIFFKELFDYSKHCNQKLADVPGKNPELLRTEKSLKLFNHILNAHQIWNNRIELKQTPYGVWELHAAEDLKSIDQSNYITTLQILDKFELNKTINYSTTRGQTYSSSVRDILFHIINHSTYHRGQIATEFKQLGLEPLATDFIIFKR